MRERIQKESVLEWFPSQKSLASSGGLLLTSCLTLHIACRWLQKHGNNANNCVKAGPCAELCARIVWAFFARLVCYIEVQRCSSHTDSKWQRCNQNPCLSGTQHLCSFCAELLATAIKPRTQAQLFKNNYFKIVRSSSYELMLKGKHFHVLCKLADPDLFQPHFSSRHGLCSEMALNSEPTPTLY